MRNDPYQPQNNQPPQGPPQYRGYGGYGGYSNPDQNAPTEPFDESDLPPTYAPQGPQYPAGSPPQWPDRADPRPAPQLRQPYTDLGYAPQAPIPRQHAPQRAAHDERAHAPQAAPQRQSHSLPHLPIAHLFLIAGIAAMAFALVQPWGVNAQGALVYIKTFNDSSLTTFGINLGPVAYQTATDLVIAVGALGLALILINAVTLVINKLLGLIGLSGLASLVFFPVLWLLGLLLFLVLLGAAGFGGIDTLSQLPIIQSHGIAGVDISQHAIGYYLWWGGIFATFIGMLGQLALRRR